MQYTIRDVPDEVDKALRLKAEKEGKTPDQAAVDALEAALGLTPRPVPKGGLRDLAGTWADDPEFDKIMEEQDQIDPELWK